MNFTEIDFTELPPPSALRVFFLVAISLCGRDQSSGCYGLGAVLRGREQLPVTLLVHHGLVDGIHIARFYKALVRE